MMASDARLLCAGDGDLPAWHDAWERTGREPFAHPDYVALFAREPDATACALVANLGDVIALVPLVVRKIPDALVGDRAPLFDAASPYGYGGPFSSAPLPPRIWSVIVDWCRSDGLVSAFLRLALDIDPPKESTALKVTAPVRNIVVDLERTAEDHWKSYERKVRKNVRRAESAGLTVSISPRFSDLDEFMSLYLQTMARRGASSFYHFDKGFFAQLQERLSQNHLAVEVRDKSGRLVSGEVVLAGDRYLYSFLGGTLQDAYPARPNDLLKHTVISFGREAGKVAYVLGGGYADGDGIFRYKRSFAPYGEVPYRTGRVVPDPATYETLTTRHREARGLPGLDPAFFPAYRAPESPHAPDTGGDWLPWAAAPEDP